MQLPVQRIVTVSYSRCSVSLLLSLVNPDNLLVQYARLQKLSIADFKSKLRSSPSRITHRRPFRQGAQVFKEPPAGLVEAVESLVVRGHLHAESDGVVLGEQKYFSVTRQPVRSILIARTPPPGDLSLGTFTSYSLSCPLLSI